MVSNDGVVARVVRGDIECTNGYIHLIDRVVFKVRNIYPTTIIFIFV